MVWSTRTIGLSLAGAAVLGGLVWVAFRNDPVPVDLIEVRLAPMVITVDATGETRIRDVFEVASPITGTALRAPVSVGDRVVAGETIVARVEPVSPSLLDARTRAQAEAAVAEARASLEVAHSDLTRSEEEAAFAQTQFDRTQSLLERGVTTMTQMETVTQQLAIANAGVAAAQSRIAMAQGTLERSEAALLGPGSNGMDEDCCVDLVAPADGVVLSIATISEHPVLPGAPLLAIGDPGDLEIVADLLSTDAVRLGAGTPAIVERWGGPSALNATLVEIEPVGQTQVSALGIEEQRVDVVFDIDTPSEDRPGLGHGYSVFMRVVEWESDSALQVPLGALFRQGDEWALFVVEGNIAMERRVTLGRRGDRTAEILDGLSPGDLIVTHPSDAVVDGTRVIDRESL
ncbi:HlyD family efflux transporter periplasmic adaptor subunit [Gymnodinialimonas sp. 2305UL16-5]|uniref:efflux RND transporter periplasmic adaptor subunit n=1 Tax=Gymnodinialimonas mytili TaxID=3126503 RepID=UPI0030AA1516